MLLRYLMSYMYVLLTGYTWGQNNHAIHMLFIESFPQFQERLMHLVSKHRNYRMPQFSLFSLHVYSPSIPGWYMFSVCSVALSLCGPSFYFHQLCCFCNCHFASRKILFSPARINIFQRKLIILYPMAN